MLLQIEAAEKRILVDVGIHSLLSILITFVDYKNEFLNLYFCGCVCFSRFLGRFGAWQCTQFKCSWISLRCWSSWSQGRYHVSYVTFLLLLLCWLIASYLSNMTSLNLFSVLHVSFRDQWFPHDKHHSHKGFISQINYDHLAWFRSYYNI